MFRSHLLTRPRAALAVSLALCACSEGSLPFGPAPSDASSPAATMAPSDDPADYDVDTSVTWTLHASEAQNVVPSDRLPPQTPVAASNNNVDIIFHQDRLFMAWRNSETHFASANTIMYLVSSTTGGASWEFEDAIEMGADVREPRFLSINGDLFFHWFEAGSDRVAFEPKHMWHMRRTGAGAWSTPEVFGRPGEIPWTIKVRGGVAYMTSYTGNHYQTEESALDVYFSRSDDGWTWEPVNPQQPVVYHGGVSEVAFEFDADGSLWAVTRNEDGDETGFGAHICHAPASDLSNWDCTRPCLPERYDSPWMFRHSNDMYVVARRDVGGPFDEQRDDLSATQRKLKYLVDYWYRPKRTAIYKLDRASRSLTVLMDLPSAGDTAFPSVRRTGEHTYLLANYTSDTSQPDMSWIAGQENPWGTHIYFMTLTLVQEQQTGQ